MAANPLVVRRAVTAQARMLREQVRAEAAAAGVAADPVEADAAEAPGEGSLGFMEWSLMVPEPKTGTLDFERFPFQRELYATGIDERERTVMKAAQVGVSALAVREGLYWTDRRGWTVLYVFPAAEQVNEFSDARVKPLIERSHYLGTRVPSGYVANKSMKQIGNGFMYLRGSNSRAGRQSVDADAVIFDEYDYLDPESIPDFEKRVGGSLHQFFRRVGYPTIPDWGMHAAYQESDRRRWMVRCAACSEWQDLDFWRNVDQDAMRVVCGKCRKPLAVASGEWVAEFPEREVRGYHVSKLVVPSIAENVNGSLRMMVRDSKKTRPVDIENFVTKDLGLPYDTPEGRLSMEAIQAAQSAGGYAIGPRDVGYSGGNVVTMGVDVASVRDLNVRVSEHFEDGRKRALWVGTVESFNDLDALMRTFRVGMAAIDHLPEYRLAMAFAERFAGQVYLVNYAGPDQRVVMKVEEEVRAASVRRTEAIDAMLDEIRQQRNLLPGNLPEGWPEQVRGLNRRKREDSTGKTVVDYVSTGATDYAHAEVYDLVAHELWLYRVGVESMLDEGTTTLEQQLEWERSALTTGDDAYQGFDGVREEGGYTPFGE